MNFDDGAGQVLSLPRELAKRKSIILGELRHRTRWFIRLRWLVPPCILAGTLLSVWIGFEFPARALVLLASIIAAYNLLLHLVGKVIEEDAGEQRSFIQGLTYWQVTLDYGAIFFLVHYTGGAASPFIFFFIFHIIFASILLPPKWAYLFAALASAGMGFLALAEYQLWIPHHALIYKGQSIDLAMHPSHVAVEILFFSASVFVTAFFSTSIQRLLRRRILSLAELSETVVNLNKRFETLYLMIQSIGTNKNLSDLFNVIITELSVVMQVKGTTIKMLSEDGKSLRYEAVYGLTENFFIGKTIDVEKSPLNWKIIQGESYVTGSVTEREMFQFGEGLAEAEIQSVLFVPLIVEKRIIGILGAYCFRTNRFLQSDVEFFQLAAGLVAVALENARAYEAIDKLVKERSWFMLKMAHNLRAPLGAMHSMIEAVGGEYLGALNADQKEHLRRVDRRGQTMIMIINELLTLAQGRTQKQDKEVGEVDLSAAAGQVLRTFQDEAQNKGISFHVEVPQNLPPVFGSARDIEQMLENLVSNAIKYTFKGGKVSLVISIEPQNQIRIEITDTGIGIPIEDQRRLFTEFFRAQNAKDVEDLGTGLGLSIVKEIVENHGGRIAVRSREGIGTTFVVFFPPCKKENADETRRPAPRD